MREIWNRIERWLEVNASETLSVLGSGASEIELQEIETLLEIKLPDDFKASYRIHNGLKESLLFIDSRYFLSLEQIKADWLNWKQMFESGKYHRDSPGKDESALMS
ncbi:MAG TPA: SMI1/KNR4 family protein [Pyrinomonadaceae bacterium]|jgi:cell wall assembly regulator SMI1|nr:SMI1/KNR4 family protein [Pyrinomonadaceae bacterium]